MKFRYARHTNKLDEIIQFYTGIIGLKSLGGFRDHEGYDGEFLGVPTENWHLEFTSTNEDLNHHPDEDDAVVFYPKTDEDYKDILRRVTDSAPILSAKNPYWNRNAIMTKDPDGFLVIIVDPTAQMK